MLLFFENFRKIAKIQTISDRKLKLAPLDAEFDFISENILKL